MNLLWNKYVEPNFESGKRDLLGPKSPQEKDPLSRKPSVRSRQWIQCDQGTEP